MAALSGTPIANIIAIAAGAYHGMALRADGYVYTWGWNGSGALGTGTWADFNFAVLSSLYRWKAIAAGQGHSLAITGNGDVFEWGRYLADTTRAYLTPHQQTVKNAKSVAGGYYNSYALAADGNIWSWGWNKYSQLGNAVASSDTYTNTPVLVRPYAWLPKFSALSKGFSLGQHMWANATGYNISWGANGNGQAAADTTAASLWQPGLGNLP